MLDRRFVLANVTVAVVLTLAIVVQGAADRTQTVERGFREAEHLANAVAEQTRLIRATLAVALETAAERVRLLEGEGRANAATLHELLQNRQATSVLTHAFFVLDAQGQLLATSRTPAPQPLDMRDLPEFRVHARGEEEDLYLGEPRAGRVGFAEGRPIINVTTRWNRPDGAFAGVVGASISLEYLLNFYRALRGSEYDVVGLVNGEGTLLVRSPHVEEAVGSNALENIDYSGFEGDEQSGRLTGGLRTGDDRVRLIAYRAIEPTSLRVFVGLDRATVLAPWWQRTGFTISIGLLALLLFTGASVLAQRYLRSREQALEAESRARDELETVFTSISDGVAVLDPDWRFTYLNREAERILRHPAEALLGRNMWESFPEGVETEAYRKYHEAVETGQPARFPLYYEPLRAHLDIRAFPHEKGLTLYFQDVSDRVETEEQLRQAQKMEAVGQLTGGVAHDFNNLLTVILGNAESLVEMLDETGPDDRRMALLRTQADLIRQAGERASTLTHRLLAFARKQPLNPKPTDINRLIGDTESLLRRTLSENIDFELVRGSGLWSALVDPHELQNALLNLAINARDAMPEGGRLTIETANMSVDMDYARMHDIPAGQYVTVAVSDTGKGMDAETTRRAFDPFFSTKAEGKGTGLGLSMVYGFARQSDGQVKIYSESGEGTTVRLYLPRCSASGTTGESTGAVRESGTDSLPEGHERILVVEDDEMVRQYTVSSLQRLGYEVEAYAEAQPALDRLKELKDLNEKEAGFDLLLTDVVLTGGLSGRLLVERALQECPGLKVLYMSGYTENAIVHQGRLDPGVHLLNKPFRVTHLARKLRVVLD